MTTWESFWGLTGGTLVALLLTFMMVGGGFFLAIIALALIPAALGIAFAGSATDRRKPAPERVMPEEGGPVIPPESQEPSIGEPHHRGWGSYALYPFLIAGAVAADIHALLGFYHLAAIGLAATGAGLFLVLLDTAPVIARRFRSELKLVGELVPLGRPMRLMVAASAGACAWGYRTADRWNVTARGEVSPKLCQAAALAMARAPGTAAPRGRRACEFACDCPLADRAVTFRMEPLATAA